MKYWTEKDDEIIHSYLKNKGDYTSVYNCFAKLISKIFNMKSFSGNTTDIKDEITAVIQTRLYSKFDDIIGRIDFDKKNPVMRYLTTVIMNDIRLYIKGKKTVIKPISIDSFDAFVLTDDGVDEHKIIVEERLAAISKIYERLEQHQKHLFHLYFTKNFTVSEISRKQNVRRTFVQKEILKIKHFIRSELGLTGNMPIMGGRKRKVKNK